MGKNDALVSFDVDELVEAALLGDTDGIAWILAEGGQSRDAIEAAVFAAVAGIRPAAALAALKKGGVDPTVPAASGTSPLHMAASLGREDSARILVCMGASRRLLDGDGVRPFVLAAEAGSLALSAFLSAGLTPSAEESRRCLAKKPR